MTTQNTEPPQVGTVIHATLLTYDLIPAFLGGLPSNLRGSLDLSDELGNLLDGNEWKVDSDAPTFQAYEESENAGWDMETIQDALNEYALDYGLYFGAADGDGSDFGFWHDVSDGDYSFTPCGHLGGQIFVASGYQHIGTYSCMAEALEAVIAVMEKDQFWPSLWWISDHGNMWPIDRDGNEITA